MEKLHNLIDRKATYRIGSFTIPVTIMDVKNSWGQDKVLITPTHGSGEQWVLLSSIKIKEVGK